MAISVSEKLLDSRLQRVDIGNQTHRVYDCPVCKMGRVNVERSVYYGKCDRCDATLIDFIPLPHQEDFLASTTTYKLLIGGFGSGKTTVACFETAHHALSTPYGKTLITAPTLQQMKEAVLPELEKFLPPWFLVGGKPKGNPPKYTLFNGHEILVYASDEEQKMRSMNLTRFHIEEGSGVDHAIFNQLQTRLRSHAGKVFDENGIEVGDKFSGVISTNPEDCWIKEDFLFKSAKLNGSKNADLKAYEPLMSPKREQSFETFISTSFDNTMLPRGTIERISAGKDERWRRKYLYSILDQRDGLVYPDAFKHMVEPFHIPHNWKRVGGYDPGTSDPTACIIGAIDPKTDIIYFYNEYYVTDQTIPYHADRLKPLINPYMWYRPIQADPSVNRRNAESMITYRSYFKQLTGITLSPANNDILLGIEKVRTYIYKGKVKFFNNLPNLRKELSLYQFTPVTERDRNTNNKPLDKNNHLMDSLRYCIVGLPENPDEFRTSVGWDDISTKRSISGFEDKEDDDMPTLRAQTNKSRVVMGFRRN